ncbi:MAG TPA: ferritin-like domain-containing protein [Terriglobales bacterium]|nr:ferritin-like domain-containing protein [Terriglobales bacterium]
MPHSRSAPADATITRAQLVDLWLARAPARLRRASRLCSRLAGAAPNSSPYLGGEPAVTPKPVRTSGQARDMLRFDLENEMETIRNYRQRVRQCEALGEIALAEQLRDILVDEQDHLIALATALGEKAPAVK